MNPDGIEKIKKCWKSDHHFRAIIGKTSFRSRPFIFKSSLDLQEASLICKNRNLFCLFACSFLKTSTYFLIQRTNKCSWPNLKVSSSLFDPNSTRPVFSNSIPSVSISISGPPFFVLESSCKLPDWNHHRIPFFPPQSHREVVIWINPSQKILTWHKIGWMQMGWWEVGVPRRYKTPFDAFL